MGRGIRILILFIITMTFTACENPIIGRREINDLEFARSLAIDTSKTIPDGVMLTLASQRIKIGSGGSAGETESSKVSSEGQTMFEAVRNFSTYLDKRPF